MGISSETTAPLQVVEFGPYRVLGMRYAGNSAQGECAALWEKGLMPRVGEIATPAGCDMSFGICRCLPGATDGSFEYIAGLPATAEASLPAGMVELIIPADTYAVFPVASLAELGGQWHAAFETLNVHSDWQAYCRPGYCDCAHHPAFELYTADFATTGRLSLYLPVCPRTER